MYVKWKLSDGTTGNGPEREIQNRGSHAAASWAVDVDGYRIGYLAEDCGLADLGTWDVTEQTEAQALTFCQAFYPDAAVLPDGHISGPPPDDV
jgi:hypothetical protein